MQMNITLLVSVGNYLSNNKKRMLMLESNMKPKYNYSTYKIVKTNSGDSRGHENDFPLVNSEWMKSNLNTTN